MATISDNYLKKLADRAKNIQKRLKEDFEPVVVEFAGSPKSGKSTTIDIITHFFKRMKFKVWAPTEGASKRTPYHLRRDLVAFNAWTLNYAISELLVAYYNVDRPHLVILDRGSFDSLAWMGLLKNMNKLKEDEYNVIKGFALHPKWSGLVSAVYLFTCNPDVSIEREYQSKLTQLPGSAMNKDMLKSLLDEYNRLKDIIKDHPLIPINTSNNTTPKKTAFQIASNVLELIEEKNG